MENPKVFISYCWSSPSHEEFVLHVAEKLMSDGIHVILDKWDLKEGQDIYKFMEQMVTDSSVKKVLIISDKKYQEKADNRKGGVGTESQIISSEIYNSIGQEKFIPIVAEYIENKPCLPTFLRTRKYIDLAFEETFFSEYEKLIRNIYNRPATVKPNLGSTPSFITNDTPQTVSTLHIYLEFKDAILKNKIFAKGLSREFLNNIISTFEELRISITNGNYDDQIIDTINRFKPYRDQFCDFVKHICLYVDDISYYEDIFTFFEKTIKYYFPPEGMHSYREEWFDNFKFITMEMYIYLIAYLIEYKKIEYFNMFTNEVYYFSDRQHRDSFDYTIFNPYLRSLEEYRKQRLNLNRISITADLLKDRSDISDINFESFMQADFILSLRSILRDNEKSWFPRSLVFKVHYGKPFELFVRAQSPRNYEIIKKLLDITSKKELIEKFEIASKKHNLSQWRINYESIDFKYLMNLDKLYDA
jgi:hypothetical protein